MNLNNLKLDVAITINGARLFPTDEQYAIILQSVENIVLGGALHKSTPIAASEEDDESKTVKKKTHNRSSWAVYTPEEETFILNRRLEGHSWKVIQKQMMALFPGYRSVLALQNRYYILMKKAREKQEPKVDADTLPSGQTPLKQNEWGGTDDLASPKF